ncbi:MAG: iron uptake porin [Synechococcales cyanobacterium CRU_2_2]|nr:iron uptake porin [Synechococcales cyanobacterium CRU_2_2]
MTKISWKALLAAPAFLGLTIASNVQAQEANLAQINQYANEGAAMGQVTSVSQLRDVQPTDWAFQALQSLVERYGCIAGYPDGTYRGNRAMTRYEFAAGLNACLDRVNELIASATADLVTQEDLAVLQRLQEEFQAELATLRGRVDALEARTAELEANQFSTTTKLTGQADFDLGSAFSGQKPDGTDVEDEVTLGYAIDLNLNTSFTGKDLLFTSLGAGNFEYVTRTGTPEATFDYQNGNAANNGISLQDLWYRFPLGKANVVVGAVGLEPDEIVPTTANLIGDGASDFFVGGNPLSYNLINGGAGAGFNYQLLPAVNVAAGYLASEAANVGNDNGLTGGDNTAFAQLTLTPFKRLTLAATYNHAYFSQNGTATSGGALSTLQGAPLVLGTSTTADTFGLNAGFALSPKLNISGWAGWGNFDSKDVNADVSLFTWAAQVGFPDLFREGNLGGLSIGAFPYATDISVPGPDPDSEDTALQAQAFYRLKLSDNISVQPSVIYIANPGGNDNNEGIWIGNIRTRFSF